MEWPALRVGDAYCVDWLDHCEEPGDQAWHNLAAVNPEASSQRTVGILVKVTPQILSMAHTLDSDNGQCSAPFHIIRGSVAQIRRLSLPREPK